ncbi:MAG: glycosyltransferase family 2 protein [Candidatus Korobacteraceae bacterium]
MNIVAMTMAYNEGAMLQRWLRHYGQHLGPQSLLVIDHGSDDGSTADLGAASHVRLPRNDAGYDEGLRVDFVNGLQTSLLKFCDVVLYVDCDEFLVPDPRKFVNLTEYLAGTTADCIRPIGLDIVHNRTEEPPLGSDGAVLTHRGYCKFMLGSCKPAITRVPLRWSVGFHTCNVPAKVDPDLFLVHLKYADYQSAIERAEVTRNLKWSNRTFDAGWSKRHRASGQELTRTFFDEPAAWIARDGAAELDPHVLAEQFNQSLVRAHSMWRRRAPIDGTLYKIPEWLKMAF